MFELSWIVFSKCSIFLPIRRLNFELFAYSIIFQLEFHKKKIFIVSVMYSVSRGVDRFFHPSSICIKFLISASPSSNVTCALFAINFRLLHNKISCNIYFINLFSSIQCNFVGTYRRRLFSILFNWISCLN